MHRHRWILLAVCALAVPARAHAQRASDARAGYDALIRRFTDYFKRGVDDPKAFAQLYTEDAVFVEADGTTTRGRAALERFVGGMFASSTIKDWSAETTTFHSDGHLAYAGGDERLVGVAKKTGKEETERLHFLVVVREQPDGKWLLAYGMETPVPAKP